MSKGILLTEMDERMSLRAIMIAATVSIRAWLVGVFAAIAKRLPRGRLHSFFHWKHSGVLIPLFISLAAGMIGIGLALHSFDAAFVFAYIFAACGFIWSIGLWLTSRWLEKRRPDTSKRRASRRNKLRGSYLGLKWGVAAGIAVVYGFSFFAIHAIYFEKAIESLDGWLVPGSKPNPVTECSFPPNATVLYFGDSAVAVDDSPFPLIVTRKGPRLIVEKDTLGRLAITVSIFGSDGRIIADIDKNKFVVNHSNYLSIERSDLNTLRVVNEEKQDVLNVNYLNPHAIKLTAMLYYPESGFVEISETGVRIRTRTYSRACIAAGVARAGILIM